MEVNQQLVLEVFERERRIARARRRPPTAAAERRRVLGVRVGHACRPELDE